MQIVIEVSEKDYLNFMLQCDNGILDEKTPSHRAKIAIANGTLLPEGTEILTKEAYSDLCLRASKRKVGKWMRLESGADGCNKCWHNDLGWARFSYCPNCGAKME